MFSMLLRMEIVPRSYIKGDVVVKLQKIRFDKESTRPVLFGSVHFLFCLEGSLMKCAGDY